jgi:hypothetical protein
LVTLFGVVPASLAAALPVLSNSDTIQYYTQRGVSLSAPFPVEADWKLTATVDGGAVHLSWPRLRPLGATMDYVVLRAPASQALTCDLTGGGAQCRLLGVPVANLHGTTFAEHVPRGTWTYRIGAMGSWTNQPGAGDIFVAGAPLTVTVLR